MTGSELAREVDNCKKSIKTLVDRVGVLETMVDNLSVFSQLLFIEMVKDESPEAKAVFEKKYRDCLKEVQSGEVLTRFHCQLVKDESLQ